MLATAACFAAKEYIETISNHKPLISLNADDPLLNPWGRMRDPGHRPNKLPRRPL